MFRHIVPFTLILPLTAVACDVHEDADIADGSEDSEDSAGGDGSAGTTPLPESTDFPRSCPAEPQACTAAGVRNLPCAGASQGAQDQDDVAQTFTVCGAFNLASATLPMFTCSANGAVQFKLTVRNVVDGKPGDSVLGTSNTITSTQLVDDCQGPTYDTGDVTFTFAGKPQLVPGSYALVLETSPIPPAAGSSGTVFWQRSYDFTPNPYAGGTYWHRYHYGNFTPQPWTNSSSVDLSFALNSACGDGVVDSTEPCDDGNLVDTDACSNACVAWSFSDFPQASAPNGWQVENHGNNPNNWTSATIDGVDTVDVFTTNAGGNACTDNSGCPTSQCVGGVCRQRVKQRTPWTDHTFGVYQWRVYIPSLAAEPNAQASVGAFLYADDDHELDFECGPGTAAARASATLRHLGGNLGPAAANEMLCYVTSQQNPHISTPIAVQTAAWHTLEVSLTPDANNHYGATWSIDGVVVQNQPLSFGPSDDCNMYVQGRKCTWQAFLGVENLAFLGDTYPTTRHDAYFDWFRHRP